MLSIVIPTYNEKLNIQKLIHKIYSTLDKIIVYEVIIVDDNSPDGTGDKVKELFPLYPTLVLASRSKKDGLGAAHLFGYSRTKGDIIVTLDADFSHNPEEIPIMLDKINHGYDVVIGSRYIKGGEVKEKAKFNIFASKIANKIARIGFGVNVSDFTNGYRMFKREVYDSLYKYNYSNGNVFLAEFIYYAFKHGYKITEIPITFIERKEGKTKTNLLRETKGLILSIIKVKLPNRI